MGLLDCSDVNEKTYLLLTKVVLQGDRDQGNLFGKKKFHSGVRYGVINSLPR